MTFATEPVKTGHEVVFPARQLSDLNQDVNAHEVLDLDCQLPFVFLHRGIADPEGFSDLGTRPATEPCSECASDPRQTQRIQPFIYPSSSPSHSSVVTSETA